MTKQELEKVTESTQAKEKAKRLKDDQVKEVVTQLRNAGKTCELVAGLLAGSEDIRPEIAEAADEVKFAIRELAYVVLQQATEEVSND